MLIRCQRCQATFSLQSGAVTGGVSKLKVECGRCHEVFEAPVADQKDTPPPQTPATPAPPDRSSGALERSATSEELARALRPRRPPTADLKPVPKRRTWPWIAAAGAVALLGIGYSTGFGDLRRMSREAQGRLQRAQHMMLRDDLGSLREATRYYTEVARQSGGAAPEAERAFGLLLQAATHQDLARRIERSIQATPPGDAAAQLLQEKLVHVGAGLRLLQEGLAAAKAALEEEAEEPVALRALALHAALVDAPEKGEKVQDQAEKANPQDPWLAYTRAALALSGPPSREKQDRALTALALALHGEPHLLRARVESAAISLDRGEPGPAREALTQVLKENPAHERAQRLIAMLPPAP